MKKGWRVILGIVMVAVVLGGLSFGVGLLTGADLQRILLNLDEQYQVTTYFNTYLAYGKQLLQTVVHLF